MFLRGVKISEILIEAATLLKSRGIAEPRREAVSLLAFSLRRDRAFLIAHSEDELSIAEENLFRQLLARRAAREPLQYIRGAQEFYGLNFIVTPDVLIPRPETEIIVEQAIEILRGKTAARFCEVGIGSGCISVAILHELADASAVGLDISPAALAIAEKNARLNGAAERLSLKISNVFENLADEKFDLIVSNPPYIPRREIAELQPEVKDYEPLSALTDGVDGLSIIEKIAAEAARFLKPDGFLLMEIGCGQARKTAEFFAENVWREVRILPDLQNIPRTVKAQTRGA